MTNVFLGLVLIGLAVPAAAQDGQPERGRAFAESNCASCHAIGPTGASRLAAAPPFRTLHQRYPVEQLAEALAEGITTGHDAMPEFRLDPPQIDDFLAYLRTLQP
ncbi:c-type cytochrome [Elioraea rosea]|uniref:c-type cytochrome n=1 Tax=Elioraea rosea TaxID=2492390 RepID=UPI0011828332|nr:cytochrome c [Elioraea rosea]